MTAAQTMARPHRRIQPGRVLMYIILILGVIVMLFPFIWMLLCSFKSNIEVIQIPPTFFPKEWVADGLYPVHGNAISLRPTSTRRSPRFA